MLLTAKTALITGAANRLGAQIARTLHQNGANLIIHYRRSETAAMALVDDLNRIRLDSAIAIAADLSASGATEMLAEKAIQFKQRLDILVNNASSFYPTPIGEIDDNNWDDLISSNFKAPLFLAQACYPALKQTSGNIINMIDIYATKPLAQHSVYSAAKAANQMLVKSLALDLAPDVRVNGIAPGAILWPQEGNNESSAAQQRILEQIPLQRRGTPESIAQVALMLATNSYITGEIIKVDGGRMLT
ncbi:MAG: pteridine reductase [Planctomycetota bacterium]|jgi:pteridine reductase